MHVQRTISIANLHWRAKRIDKKECYIFVKKVDEDDLEGDNKVMYQHRHTQYDLRIIWLFRSVQSVITEQDDMIICCDTHVYFYFYLLQNLHGSIQILPSSSTSSSVRPSDDAKRETEPQRIKRFQGYLLQFTQWHNVKPCGV